MGKLCSDFSVKRFNAAWKHDSPAFLTLPCCALASYMEEYKLVTKSTECRYCRDLSKNALENNVHLDYPSIGYTLYKGDPLSWEFVRSK
jgi:hypothetical protein